MSDDSCNNEAWQTGVSVWQQASDLCDEIKNISLSIFDYLSMFDNFGFSVDTIIRALDFDLAKILAQASDLEVLCSTHGLNLQENLLPIVQNFEEKANSLRADLETGLE
jgi:hypothetical protein